MKKWLMAVVFGIVLVLGACGGGDDGGSEEPADSGSTEEPADEEGGETADASDAEAIYKENCASCHGDDLSGESGPDLTDIGNKLSQDEIESQIEEGGNGMPPGLVSGDDLSTLSEWLAEQK